MAGWQGPRTVTSRDELKFSNYRKVWPLSRTSHQGAESYCLDVSRSSLGSAEGLKPGRQLAGIREPSQRNQQSRKCLVSQKPCQRARPQGRSQATGSRGGQDGKPNRRRGWARRRGVRDTSKGGQQDTGRAMGLAVHRRGAGQQPIHWIWLHPSSSLKGLRNCLGHIRVASSMMPHVCQGWQVTLRRLLVITRTKHHVDSAV